MGADRVAQDPCFEAVVARGSRPRAEPGKLAQAGWGQTLNLPASRDDAASAEDDAWGFYDRLAGDYDRIFADWPASVRRQGETLDRPIRARLGDRTGPVVALNASCGIGPQAIGLALYGHAVHPTDLSPMAVEGVFDIDIVLSCDNALAHLLADDDPRWALRGLRAQLVPGGVLLLSIRDDVALLATRPTATLPSRFSGPDGSRIVSQTWDWSDGVPLCTMHLFVLTQTEADGRRETAHGAARLRAIRRAELGDLLRGMGWADSRWHLPDESGYDQPLLTAIRTP
jgi:hypothetical protein